MTKQIVSYTMNKQKRITTTSYREQGNVAVVVWTCLRKKPS
jgi:hypothetical protein